MVTVAEVADTSLATVLGTEVGIYSVPWCAEAGVALRTGVKVASVEDGGLQVADGGYVAADEVLVGRGRAAGRSTRRSSAPTP